MNHTITDFQHKMAAHCESGTLSGILNYNGLEITEPMVFGLANDIFFGYMKMKNFNFPTFFVRIQPGKLRTNIGKRLGVKYYSKTYKNQEEATQELDALLLKNIPVAVQVDFFYMDYLPSWYRVHNNVHFITVVGKEGSQYLVSDCYFPELARIEQDSLIKGRFAGGLSAPKGFMYYPTLVPQDPDLKKQLKIGIKKASFNMIKLPIPFVGIKGIRKFGNKITEWPSFARDIENLSHEVMKINVLLEDQGTGGAGFRYMYATFLRQASEILNSEEIKEMSKRLMEIGDGWREISVFAARMGKNRDLGVDKLRVLGDMILKRADVEKEFFTDLYKIVK